MLVRVELKDVVPKKKYSLRYIRTNRIVKVVVMSTEYYGKYAVKDKEGYPRRCVHMQYVGEKLMYDFDPVDMYGVIWELLEEEKKVKK